MKSLALILGIAACLASCSLFGDRDNPVDPDGSKYQGYTIVRSSAEIEPVSPADGGSLKSSAFMINEVKGASAYELRVAASASDLDASPLFDKADYTNHSMTLLSDSILTWKTYYWKARARTAGGWDKKWSQAYSFKTDFPYVWIDRSKTSTATAGLYWNDIASSSDGKYLVAGAHNGYIWTSSDYGTNWTAHTGPGSKAWQAIASSANGQYLVAAVDIGYIWTSADYGATWSSRAGAGSWWWQSVASSADGRYLVATEDYGYIHTSSDYGADWTMRTGAGYGQWESIASSADGQYLVACMFSGYIWTSSDYGASWTSRSGPGLKYWSSVEISSDGRCLAAADLDNGVIWTSSDFGATWNKRASSNDFRYMFDITMNSDGNMLAVTVRTKDDNADVAISLDYGVTWRSEGITLLNSSGVIASSADFTRLAVAVPNIHIWTGSNLVLTK